MNIDFTGKSFEISDRLRQYTADKLEKLEKYVDDIIEVRVVLAVEKFRHIAEMHLHGRHADFRATEETSDMMSAINLVVSDLEKQARRAKKKFQTVTRSKKNGPSEWQVDVLDAGSFKGGPDAGDGGEAPPRIIKSGTLPIKPMSIEEAAMQLDSSRSEFIVFRDSGSNRINVLYKRKDQNYGLIAPEF